MTSFASLEQSFKSVLFSHCHCHSPAPVTTPPTHSTTLLFPFHINTALPGLGTKYSFSPLSFPSHLTNSHLTVSSSLAQASPPPSSPPCFSFQVNAYFWPLALLCLLVQKVICSLYFKNVFLLLYYESSSRARTNLAHHPSASALSARLAWHRSSGNTELDWFHHYCDGGVGDWTGQTSISQTCHPCKPLPPFRPHFPHL